MSKRCRSTARKLRKSRRKQLRTQLSVVGSSLHLSDMFMREAAYPSAWPVVQAWIANRRRSETEALFNVFAARRHKCPLSAAVDAMVAITDTMNEALTNVTKSLKQATISVQRFRGTL